jgi:hypothetical protein
MAVAAICLFTFTHCCPPGPPEGKPEPVSKAGPGWDVAGQTWRKTKLDRLEGKVE